MPSPQYKKKETEKSKNTKTTKSTKNTIKASKTTKGTKSNGSDDSSKKCTASTRSPDSGSRYVTHFPSWHSGESTPKASSPKFDPADDPLAKFSLDDMRRFANKLIDLGVIELPLIQQYVEDDPGNDADRVLCTYDAKVKWASYNIKNQDFTFPNFMKNPVYLARGGFGTVVKCFRYGEPVAVKKVDVPDARHWEMALRLLRELVIMKQSKKLGQRHICKIIDIFGDPTVKSPEDLKHIYIVMPLYRPGALDSVSITSPAMFKTVAGHSLSALHFLHLHKLMHRDIKKENIFYDERRNRAYLADLGQARTFHHGAMSGNGEVGTRCYLSPEILQGRRYDYRSDVYSLGQTWYEVLCLTGAKSLFPYGKSGGSEQIGMQRALDPSKRGTVSTSGYAKWAEEKWAALEEKKVEWNEENLVTIIEMCLVFDQKQRADTAKLFELPYFFPFVTEDRVMDLREVETDDYAEIKQRIFDLQHGSCQQQPLVASRSGQLQKMCSMAVQYFDKDAIMTTEE